ncbi:MAG: amidase [Desulfobacterales bacterium]|nr:amidase [Desulfobacterales bacterium]
MSGFKEYDQYDGLGLAELIRKKEMSAEEVMEEAIRRIERFNPKLNAVITPMFDIGRQTVRESMPDGPFTGVPFLLKDLISAYAGVPLTSGCKALKSYTPEHDSELVTRYKKSGVATLGKTNTPEFGLLGCTEPELHGPTRNPWNTDHTPGGSSGGSAAAVASGMTPLASGGDGGGSIRIPAACCGLFGLKPTRGRVPTGPDVGALWQGAAVEHVLTRSVRDSAAMLDAIQGADAGAPYVITPPERPYTEEIQRSPGPLKIAFSAVSPLETEVHPECVKAVEDAAKLMEKLGCDVEEARPDIDGKSLAGSYMALYFGEVATEIEELETIIGRKARPSDVEPATWTVGLLGRTYSAGYFVKNMRKWGVASRVMGRFLQKYDLYMTPTLAFPPSKIGELAPKPAELLASRVVNALGLGRVLKASGLVDKMAIDNLIKTPFTQLANLTGQPAISLPLHWTPDGLPCGVQFIAPFGDEAALFRISALLEKEKPWFHKRPPMIE